MTENINDHKTYSLTFRFLSGEFIYKDEYTVYFSSEDFENNLNKQQYNKNIRSVDDIIEDYYYKQYHFLDIEEKNKIHKFSNMVWSDAEFELHNDYKHDPKFINMRKQYIDCEIYNDYESDYFNELRKQYINYVIVYTDVDSNEEYRIKTHTSYIFDNKSFPSDYSLYNYIFKNNDKLTETNYGITVVTSIIYEKEPEFKNCF